MNEESSKNNASAQPTIGNQIFGGTFPLNEPIRAKSKDITELKYDFTKLSGWEYVEAMDMDANARNVFRITQKQALCLFAAAAGKATDDVDATDIRERMGATDAARAVQLATVFLVSSMKEGKAIS